MGHRNALFGGLLGGTAPVRFIYTDEAGTSAAEPVTVVVGIIIHADTQWMPTAKRIEGVLAKVPERYRDGFTFHAASVWGSPKYRDGWSHQDRMALLLEMMAIPRVMKLSFAYGLYYRDAAIKRDLGGLTLTQYQHAQAFADCMASADQYIRDYAAPSEVATVVAEDVPEMRKNLRAVVDALKKGVLRISGAIVSQTERMQPPSSSAVTTMNMRVTRIVDDIHFTPKARAPILQVADAVAFGFRRYHSHQKHGLTFAEAILGSDPEAAHPSARRGDGACGFFFLEPMKKAVNPFSGA